MVDITRAWAVQALCRRVREGRADETFYAAGTQGRVSPTGISNIKGWREAKAVCLACPVMHQCRRDTIGEPEGVWGGYDPRQRAAIRKEMLGVWKDWPEARRLTLGRLVHGLRRPRSPGGSPRAAFDRIQQMTGLPRSVQEGLLAQYEAHLAALKAARPVDMLKPRRKLPFPDVNGSRDCWARSAGYVKDAFYKGETADGTFVRVQVAIDRHSAAIKWVPSEDVRFHRDVARYTVRKGKRDDQVPAAA